MTTAVALVALLGCGTLHFAVADGKKAKMSPCIWQGDPINNYAKKGVNYCAPVAVAQGLIYLRTVRGLNGLVENSGQWGQFALANELARSMGTDPDKGTTSNKIVSGLARYVNKHGYTFERLEVTTWGRLSKSHQKYVVGDKTNLRWMTAAVQDPDTVTICNFGWYRKRSNGRYERNSGHWVTAVGAGPRLGQFDVHNPYFDVKRQKSDTAITLRPTERNFVYAWKEGDRSGDLKMSGYYQAQGPGLAFNPRQITAAVLDSVIVFKLRKL